MLYLMQESKTELLPDIAIKKWKKNDFTIVFRYGAGKVPIADIVLGSSKSGGKYLSPSFSLQISETGNLNDSKRTFRSSFRN